MFMDNKVKSFVFQLPGKKKLITWFLHFAWLWKHTMCKKMCISSHITGF